MCCVETELVRPGGSYRLGGGYCTSPDKGGHGFGSEWQWGIRVKYKRLLIEIDTPVTPQTEVGQTISLLFHFMVS